jgi:co-chaperonin GroES (HSP10)
MKFRPLHDRVVIKRIEAEEKRRSLPSAQGVATRAASSSRSTSRSATECCSASGQALKSSSTASST